MHGLTTGRADGSRARIDGRDGGGDGAVGALEPGIWVIEGWLITDVQVIRHRAAQERVRKRIGQPIGKENEDFDRVIAGRNDNVRFLGHPFGQSRLSTGIASKFIAKAAVLMGALKLWRIVTSVVAHWEKLFIET